MARKLLEDLLQESSANKQEGNTLYIGGVEDPTVYSISDGNIERLVVAVPSIYLILDGADKSKNNITSIELTVPGAVLSLKNARPDCMIAINKSAEIAYLTATTGGSISDSITLGSRDNEEE